MPQPSCARASDDSSAPEYRSRRLPRRNTRGPLFVHPGGIVKRTHFHAMAMYANALQPRVAKASLAADTLTQGSVTVPVADAVATVDESGKRWAPALVNRHPELPLACIARPNEGQGRRVQDSDIMRRGVGMRSFTGAWARLALLACGLPGCHPDAPATVTDPQRGAEQPFSGTIILGRPTDRSVTASLMSERDADVFLEYGASGGAFTGRSETVSLKAGVPGNVELTALQPDARYRYRVRTSAAPAGPVPAPKEYGFLTQRAPGQSFTFTLDADPHHGDASFDSTIYSTTMGRIAADSPDFHVDLGDSFMTEKLGAATYAQAAARVAGLRPYWAISGPSVPLYLVIGNHEGEQGWDATGAESLPVWATRARQLYYPNPVPNAFYSGSTTPDRLVGVRDGYYAWTWGDALFLVLDPYWYVTANPNRDFWQWTLGPEQYAWLKATLRNSQARYKFVFAHQLLGGILGNPRGGIEAASLYEWGGQNPDGSWGFPAHRPGWEKPIHQLFVETGVTAFFHGHDHFFGYQQLDGIVYQEVPQPSYARTNDNSSATEYGYRSGVFLGSSGYLRIRVTPARATVEYVKVYPTGAPAGMQTGQVAYSYSLSPRP